MTLKAGHVLRPDHRVHDRFFGGLYSGRENIPERIIRQHRDSNRWAGSRAALRIRSREGNENVTGAIPGDRAQPPETKGGPARQALSLMRQERCVGSNNNNDGAAFVAVLSRSLRIECGIRYLVSG